MTAPPPDKRIALDRPSSDFNSDSGYFGETSTHIIRPMTLFDTDCNVHSTGCWGFFVVRTAYGDVIDDDRIATAMVRLEDAVHNIIACWRRDSGWDNCEEMDDYARSHYHSVLLQDASLAGATIPQARQFFRDWATPICGLDEDDSSQLDSSARFRGFILLDEQVLSNIETFPTRGDLDAFDALYLGTTTQWVKLIGAENVNPDLERDRIAISAYGLAIAFGQLAMEQHGVGTFAADTDVCDEFTGTELGWDFFRE